MLRIALLLILSSLFSVAQAQLELIALLPSGIQETSGLVYVQNTLITHNDSGGSNALYALDSNTGTVTRTCYIANASNIDWEDLAADDQFIYIADFGNNTGARTDLKIYRISQSDFFNTTNDTVFADTINFTYADQTDFTPGSNETNYDAEALMVKGDSLYIFTKRWLDQSSSMYVMSKYPGTYNLHPQASIASDGLITGAIYDSLSTSIYLCGYGPPIPFLLEIKNFNGLPLLTSNITKSILEVPIGSSVQIEGITLKNNNELFISSESSVLGDASLMKMEKPALVSTINRVEQSLHPYPNPTSDYLFLAGDHSPCVSLYNYFGQQIESTCANSISLKHLPAGIYFLVEESGKTVHRIVIQRN